MRGNDLAFSLDVSSCARIEWPLKAKESEHHDLTGYRNVWVRRDLAMSMRLRHIRRR